MKKLALGEKVYKITKNKNRAENQQFEAIKV